MSTFTGSSLTPALLKAVHKTKEKTPEKEYVDCDLTAVYDEEKLLDAFKDLDALGYTLIYDTEHEPVEHVRIQWYGMGSEIDVAEYQFWEFGTYEDGDESE